MPIVGIFIIICKSYISVFNNENDAEKKNIFFLLKNSESDKLIALVISVINFLLSLLLLLFFNFTRNHFQFVVEPITIYEYNLFLGVDGISIYFILLTTLIMPIALLSNWKSILENIKWYLSLMLLLETLLLTVFLVLDILLFYIFFESILPPLFLLIGLYGSSNKVRASFY